MSCESETADVLRKVGHRITPQRMSILAAVRHSDRHISANTIFDEVKRSYPYIDISTVYRTLNAARDLGLVHEVDQGRGDAEFEWSGETHHYHLICRLCGKETVIDGEQVEAFVDAISREHGFVADLAHMAIPGVCKDCARALT
jgi:Fur family transcriptional regulator, ferric uptake regulator